MSGYTLDPALMQDTHHMGMMDTTQLLLMRNAHFPWFILVPQTDEIEFYELDAEIQASLMEQVTLISGFIKKHFKTDKINTGIIGNIVSQLHIHVVGRHRRDICWPGVVWGTNEFAPYADTKVEEIRQQLSFYLKI